MNEYARALAGWPLAPLLLLAVAAIGAAALAVKRR
jgi:hypothetical protein